MLTDQAKAKIKQGKKEESKLLEMVEETHKDLSHSHEVKTHFVLPPSSERFSFKLTAVA
jgi:hypothetical protein